MVAGPWPEPQPLPTHHPGPQPEPMERPGEARPTQAQGAGPGRGGAGGAWALTNVLRVERSDDQQEGPRLPIEGGDGEVRRLVPGTKVSTVQPRHPRSARRTGPDQGPNSPTSCEGPPGHRISDVKRPETSKLQDSWCLTAVVCEGKGMGAPADGNRLLGGTTLSVYTDPGCRTLRVC